MGMPIPSTNEQVAWGVLRRARYQGKITIHMSNVPSPQRSGLATCFWWASKITQRDEIKGRIPNMSRASSCPNKLTVITAVSHVIDKTKKNINQEKRAGAMTGCSTGGSTATGAGCVR